jgi:tetratricopeptide (TPR) repeat protein
VSWSGGSFPATLRLLEAASLVWPGDSAGDEEYRFKHTLIQETAYAGLLRERRIELHRQVAEATLRLHPETALQRPAVLAYHYYHGGDDERAFRFALRAGNLAGRNYAHEEAVANYDIALEVAPRLSSPTLIAQVRQAFIGKGTALEVSGRHPEARQVYRTMEAFARRTGDRALEADALNRLATAATVGNDPAADVAAMLARAEQLARQADDPLTLARTLWNQGLRLRFLAPEKADAFFRRALEIARRPACLDSANGDEFRELEAFILTDMMVSGLTSGRRLEALRIGTDALQAFRTLGNRAMIADVMGGLGLMRYAGAEFETGLALSEEGSAISQAIGNPWGISYNGWTRLAILSDRGEWNAALEFGRFLLGVAENVPFLGIRGSLNGIVSGICLSLGEIQESLVYAQRMVDIIEASGSLRLWLIWSRGVLGRARLAAGDVSAAAALLEPFRELPEGVAAVSQAYYIAGPAIAALDVAQGAFERGMRFADTMIERLEAERADRYAAEMRYWRAHMHAGRGALAEADADLRWAVETLEPAVARALLWQVHAFRAEVLEKGGEDSAPAVSAPCGGVGRGDRGGLTAPQQAAFLGQPRVESARASPDPMTPGSAFTSGHLSENLDRLEAGQLVRPLVDPEPSYSFKHNLVQQVAYESLLANDRRALHRRVGETLERIHGHRSAAVAETLAGHFERAGDSEKALTYTSLAAEQAMRRFATAEAATLFAKAIGLSGEVGFDEARLLHL